MDRFRVSPREVVLSDSATPEFAQTNTVVRCSKELQDLDETELSLPSDVYRAGLRQHRWGAGRNNVGALNTSLETCFPLNCTWRISSRIALEGRWVVFQNQ
jgi:hypothetical protein